VPFGNQKSWSISVSFSHTYRHEERPAIIGPISDGVITLSHLAFLMSTASICRWPREITRWLSGETSKEKILSESNAVSFLGTLPPIGTDHRFPTPFSFLAYRIDLLSGDQV
jgi:hypothetical protein